MGFFDIDDEKLQGYWHRAWLEANRGYVDFREYPYLEHALYQYARENDCTLTQAIEVAKTGRKSF